jgi:hypothetical protein
MTHTGRRRSNLLALQDFPFLPSTVLQRRSWRVYSITSSARTSSAVGNVTPSALAVFMLIANSTLAICCIGRSEGLPPREKP